MLGVSRNTVVVAYELLVAEGLAEGRQGSGVRAVGTPQAPRFDLSAQIDFDRGSSGQIGARPAASCYRAGGSSIVASVWTVNFLCPL